MTFHQESARFKEALKLQRPSDRLNAILAMSSSKTCTGGKETVPDKSEEGSTTISSGCGGRQPSYRKDVVSFMIVFE